MHEQVNNPQAAGLIGGIVNHSSNLPVANKVIRRFGVSVPFCSAHASGMRHAPLSSHIQNGAYRCTVASSSLESSNKWHIRIVIDTRRIK